MPAPTRSDKETNATNSKAVTSIGGTKFQIGNTGSKLAAKMCNSPCAVHKVKLCVVMLSVCNGGKYSQ